MLPDRRCNRQTMRGGPASSNEAVAGSHADSEVNFPKHTAVKRGSRVARTPACRRRPRPHQRRWLWHAQAESIL
jgi:hypothetical protein